MDDRDDYDNDKASTEGRQQRRLYTFGGRFWRVPANFAFTEDAKVLLGWRLWIGVQAGYEYSNKCGNKAAGTSSTFQYIEERRFHPKEVSKEV